MFDDRDPNRDLQRDAYLNRYADEGSGYAPLIALFAIALIVGGLFIFAPSSEQKVATNSPVTQSAPAPVPPTPAPPAKAPQQ
jgi:hypothetical protein